ncbi:hypothetical protein BC834DRAFT_165693 [Gloeopeniophorella convolvens]|nr:hypothetical protein BC834DRAFT_165693 [Gloeopeniophorella convolvens]
MRPRIPLLVLASLTAGTRIAYAAAHAPRVTARCLTGEACFPSAATLAAFNRTIGGKLHAERPIGAVCYPGDPAFNQNACDTVTQNWNWDQWLSFQFGDLEQTNWETCGPSDACLVPRASNSTCGQGSIPAFSVHATTSADVVAYVKFATLHNLRIVVKNTGHDERGRSAGQGGFAIWTHGIQSQSRNKSFVPAGCQTAPQDSLTFGAGTQWWQAYAFADEQLVVVVGADGGQVGAAGGWFQGGGHSVLSPTYGLGVDNLLQATIVTADGVERTVSECQDPDLFFALRGGGPATWGIVTGVTYKALPAPDDFTLLVAAASFTNASDNTKLLEAYAAQAPHWADIGMGGVITAFSENSTFFGILKGGSVEDAQAAIAPITGLFPEGETPIIAPSPSFLSIFSSTFDVNNKPVGINSALSSRLIPRHYFEEDSAAVVDALLKGQALLQDQAETQSIQIFLDSPPPGSNPNTTSVTPVWYNSPWHVVYTSTWDNDATTAEQRQRFANLHQAAQVLRDFAPDGGAYSSQADVFEPDHENAFWGAANVAKLKAAKAKYDPENVFTVWQGIGWDGEQDPKFRCYQPLDPTLGAYAH